MEITVKVVEDASGDAKVVIEGAGSDISFPTYPAGWAQGIADKAHDKGLDLTVSDAQAEIDAILGDRQVQMLLSRIARLTKKKAVVDALKQQEKARADATVTGLVDNDDWMKFLGHNDDVESALPDGVSRETYNDLLGLG